MIGAKLLSHYTLKCLCSLPAFPVDEKCEHLSLPARAQHMESSSSSVEVAKETVQQGLGFLPRECRDKSSTVKNDLRGCTSNSPCSVSINSFLIQLLGKYSWSAQRLCTMVWPFANSMRLFRFFFFNITALKLLLGLVPTAQTFIATA